MSKYNLRSTTARELRKAGISAAEEAVGKTRKSEKKSKTGSKSIPDVSNILDPVLESPYDLPPIVAECGANFDAADTQEGIDVNRTAAEQVSGSVVTPPPR